MTSKRHVWLFSAATMFALNFFQRGLGLIAITVLARLLDATGLGAYAFAQSVAQAFSGWARLGLDAGTHVTLANTPQTEKAQAEAVVGEALSAMTVVSALTAIAITALSRLIAKRMFGAPELVEFIYPAAAIYMGQMMSQAIYAVFAGLGEFSAYARATMIGSVSIVLLAGAGGLAHGAIGASWGLALAQIVLLCTLVLSLRRVLAVRGLRIRPRIPGYAMLDILKVGFPFYAGVFLAVPADFFALALLGRNAGVLALGQLRVSQAVMSVATVLPVALSGPLITHLAAQNAAGNGKRTAALQAKVIWALAIVIATVLSAIWPVSIEVIFGHAFTQAEIIGVLAIAAFIPTMLLTVLQGALLAEKRALLILALGSVQAVATTLAAIWLIPHFHLAGYFGTQTLSYGVVALLTAVAYGRTIRCPTWAVPLVALTVALWALLVAEAALALSLSCHLIIGLVALATTMAVIVLFVFDVDERRRAVLTLTQMRAEFAASWGSP